MTCVRVLTVVLDRYLTILEVPDIVHHYGDSLYREIFFLRIPQHQVILKRYPEGPDIVLGRA
jgi:hypothetical protein